MATKSLVPSSPSQFERGVARDIIAWQNRPPKAPGKVARAIKRVGGKAKVVVPAPLANGVLKAIQGALELLDDAADLGASSQAVAKCFPKAKRKPRKPDDFSKFDLEVIEKAVAHLRKIQQATLATEGAATGLLGIPGLLADIPISMGLTFAAMKQVRIAYGFDPTTPAEKELLLAVLGESVDDNVEMGTKIAFNVEAKALANMATRMTWKEMQRRAARHSPKFAQEALLVAMRVAAQRVGIRLTHKMAARSIVILGAIAGGAMNYAYVRTLTHRMMMRSRQHYLERKFDTDLRQLVAPA